VSHGYGPRVVVLVEQAPDQWVKFDGRGLFEYQTRHDPTIDYSFLRNEPVMSRGSTEIDLRVRFDGRVERQHIRAPGGMTEIRIPIGRYAANGLVGEWVIRDEVHRHRYDDLVFRPGRAPMCPPEPPTRKATLTASQYVRVEAPAPGTGAP